MGSNSPRVLYPYTVIINRKLQLAVRIVSLHIWVINIHPIISCVLSVGETRI